MSNKIHIPYYFVANTIYIAIRDADGKVWNGATFETWSDENIADYVANATYTGGSLYVALFPLIIISGFYTIQIFLQAGILPSASADIWIGNLAGYWDKDNSNLVGVRVDTLVEYDSGERFSEKSLEEVPTAAGGAVVTIERTPKVQVKSTENVETVQVPAEIEVLPPGVERTSAAEITGGIERKSSTKVGP